MDLLYIELQYVGVAAEQRANVWRGAAKVAVNKLFDIPGAQ